MKHIAVASLLLAVSACLGTEDAVDIADGTWVGTITTEGNVTTVINESGSVWGGTATLVEEASIGVELGAPEYMLGYVPGVAATDERIYVIDRSLPVVRIYDYDGGYVADLGRDGEGPGEYGFPESIAIIPDGRVFVRDVRPTRITSYLPTGELEATFPRTTYMQTPIPMTVTPDGVPYLRDRINDGDDAPIIGMVPHSTDGPMRDALVPPEFGYEPEVLVSRSANAPVQSGRVPFMPTVTWAMAPSGAMIAGLSTEYRFELHHPDGRVIVIESNRELVSVHEEEAAWHQRRLTAFFRLHNPEWTWDGPESPTTKPPYTAFIPSNSGEIWVVGSGRGEHVPGCTENPQPGEVVTPCWRESPTIDVFDAQGRYLGPVELPDDVRLSPRSWIRDRTVITVVEDDAGTIMVKRYRLVLPGEEGR